MRGLLLLSALIFVTHGQNCLPQQEKCGSTCCNTAAQFTCCPYQGGFCAPPDSQCCRAARPDGLCLKTQTCCPPISGCCDADSECCEYGACAKHTTEECCDSSAEPKCAKGPNSGCCRRVDDSKYLGKSKCYSEDERCCVPTNAEVPAYDADAYVCPNSTTCCTVQTTRKVSPLVMRNCCAKGTVCCPRSDVRRNVHSLAKQQTLITDAELKPQVTHRGGRTSLGQPLTGCADPTKEFCCGGVACPTETLCCPGSGPSTGDDGDGCCFGILSKNAKCYDNGRRCPSHWDHLGVIAAREAVEKQLLQEQKNREKLQLKKQL